MQGLKGIQFDRKFNKYESMGQLSAPALEDPDPTNFVSANSGSRPTLVDHSLSRRRQSQQPLATSSRTSAKGTRSSTRIPQRPAATHLKDLSFFLKMLEAKVRYDPEINDDFPIRMR